MFLMLAAVLCLGQVASQPAASQPAVTSAPASRPTSRPAAAEIPMETLRRQYMQAYRQGMACEANSATLQRALGFFKQCENLQSRYPSIADSETQEKVSKKVANLQADVIHQKADEKAARSAEQKAKQQSAAQGQGIINARPTVVGAPSGSRQRNRADVPPRTR